MFVTVSIFVIQLNINSAIQHSNSVSKISSYVSHVSSIPPISEMLKYLLKSAKEFAAYFSCSSVFLTYLGPWRWRQYVPPNPRYSCCVLRNMIDRDGADWLDREWANLCCAKQFCATWLIVYGPLKWYHIPEDTFEIPGRMHRVPKADCAVAAKRVTAADTTFLHTADIS
jgi:hypothetical protein